MNTKARSLLLALLFLPAAMCLSQPTHQDSLWRAWADTSANWNDRVGALATHYATDTTLGPLEVARRAMPPNSRDTVSREFALQRATASYALGMVHDADQRYSKALPLLQQALGEFTRLGEKRLQAEISQEMGLIFVRMGQYNTASTYQMQALKGFEALGDTTNMCIALTHIGYTFGMIGDGVRYEQTYKRCLDLAAGRDRETEFECLIRLSDDDETAAGSAQATAYWERAKAMVAQGTVLNGRRKIDLVEARLFLNKNECDSAMERFDRTLAVYRRDRATARDWISYLLACKAQAHLCAHRYLQAVELASEGLAIATEVGLSKEALDNLRPLALAYEGLGDDRNALRTWKQFYTMKDSANSALSASSLSGALLAADFAKRQFADSLANAEQSRRVELENEAIVAREKNTRNVFLFAGIGVLLLAGGLWSRLRLTRRSRAAIQKEKDISEGLLLNILPEEVAAELKAKGHADAKHFDDATILFTDFKGFTEMSEQLSPADLVEELNVCFKAFDEIVALRGIEKIKTIGDAYMCAGGLPVPSSSTPAGVVQAALEMQAFMIARKAERDVQGKPAFEMRVGIHTGPVVAGIVGVRKFAYDIWGDTVNIAIRMESSGEVGQVNISESTYALVKDAVIAEDGVASTHGVDPNGSGVPRPAFTFTPRGKVQAKGKGEMEMYFVENT